MARGQSEPQQSLLNFRPEVWTPLKFVLSMQGDGYAANKFKR